MNDLQKAIQENSVNLKTQENQKTSNLLDAIRGGEAPAELWSKIEWNKSF
ncbi:hypothetical protein PSI19_03180 [Xenorhabdus khoisanae]|nr:hypothetical protein [Xenorhabdus khoisanae]MDC9612900.1 hypothetical protein [Xenorhabdus khoisanae]